MARILITGSNSGFGKLAALSLDLVVELAGSHHLVPGFAGQH